MIDLLKTELQEVKNDINYMDKVVGNLINFFTDTVMFVVYCSLDDSFDVFYDYNRAHGLFVDKIFKLSHTNEQAVEAIDNMFEFDSNAWGNGEIIAAATIYNNTKPYKLLEAQVHVNS